MKIRLAQLNPTIGDLNKNTEGILAAIARAREAGADLLVLPELSITGYPPRDLLHYQGFVDSQLEKLELIRKQTAGLTVLCGYVEPNERPVGRPFHNSVAVIQDEKFIANYRKQLLPNYDVFDEVRYFEEGKESCVFELSGKRVAVTICEDLWNVPGFLERGYERQPIDQLRKANADLLVNLSASPFHLGKPEVREKLIRKVSEDLGIPVIFCNQVGANDELVFDGSSFVVSRGKICARAGEFIEEDISFSLESDVEVAAPERTEEAWLSGAVELGIRDYVVKCGAEKVCLGLSGGIDSSVAVVLAARALGSEAVTGVSLPSPFTSDASLEDARVLAKNLGIEFHELSIEPFFETYLKQWTKWFDEEPKSLTNENIQPRIRMTLLMAIANETNALLLNTSNKSEIATGYATLYGDSAGALSVLGDLTKKQVYSLAEFFNREVEVIPRRVLERAPTAELKENQTDQDSLPPYDVLDRLVRDSVEKSLAGESLESAGANSKWAQLFSKLYARSEYKRSQLPPVIRVSPKAFGIGRRIPIVKA